MAGHLSDLSSGQRIAAFWLDPMQEEDLWYQAREGQDFSLTHVQFLPFSHLETRSGFGLWPPYKFLRP